MSLSTILVVGTWDPNTSLPPKYTRLLTHPEHSDPPEGYIWAQDEEGMIVLFEIGSETVIDVFPRYWTWEGDPDNGTGSKRPLWWIWVLAVVALSMGGDS